MHLHRLQLSYSSIQLLFTFRTTASYLGSVDIAKQCVRPSRDLTDAVNEMSGSEVPGMDLPGRSLPIHHAHLGLGSRHVLEVPRYPSRMKSILVTNWTVYACDGYVTCNS
jgi:hypothetical protein